MKGSYYEKFDDIDGFCSPEAPPPLLLTSTKSAEIIKHASNAFLALKISFINAVSNLCEAVDADVEQVEPDTARDLFYIRVDCFTEVRDSIDEGNFEGEEGVGGMLDDLRALGRGQQKGRRRFDAAGPGDRIELQIVVTRSERLVDGNKKLGFPITFSSQNNAVPIQKIRYRGALTQEFGVRDDIE